MNDDGFEVEVNGGTPQVVDSIPGWVHNITNIGKEEAIVMLWANEIFDPDNPDTIACKVKD
jgi:UDP-2-acetamido-2,6-beta-L-arabino-hexul-4-ose reductase